MMDSLELLLTRQSNAYLTEPSPNNHDTDLILKAGMRVPDHGGLMPWQFLIVAEQGLQKLSDIFAATVDENDEKQLIKISKEAQEGISASNSLEKIFNREVEVISSFYDS